MRLWNYTMLDVLPRQQLISQLRECVAIAKDIYETGHTNHILINKIMDYPIEHFQEYCDMVISEMEYRGYKVSQQTIDKLSKYLNYDCNMPFCNPEDKIEMFKNWHNTRYLRQCYFNLQEKFDCGGINEEEWSKVKDKISKMI